MELTLKMIPSRSPFSSRPGPGDERDAVPVLRDADVPRRDVLRPEPGHRAEQQHHELPPQLQLHRDAQRREQVLLRQVLQPAGERKQGFITLIFFFGTLLRVGRLKLCFLV